MVDPLKILTRTNTLAYFGMARRKGFEALTPVAFIIKTYIFIMYRLRGKLVPLLAKASVLVHAKRH
jgi:hypothetical protein